MLAPDGHIRFAVSTNGREQERYMSDRLALPGANFTKLTLIPGKGRFSIYVNDELITQLREDGLAGGGIGIIASGRGEFAFRNLIIYKRP